MTTITQLREIIDTVRNFSNKKDKLNYLNQQPRDVLNFLSGNIKKDGIAKTIASEIPNYNPTFPESTMENIVYNFEDAANYTRRTDKIRFISRINLRLENKKLVLTILYGSLKLGVTIPIPDPEFGDIIKPQLCNTKFKFNRNNYIEQKWNGHRCIVMNINNEIYTYTRNGKILDINNLIKNQFKNAIPNGSVTDGEIIDNTGDFFSLKRKSNNIIYQIFDIIFKNEKSLTNLSLKNRLIILKESIIENNHVKISQPLNFESSKEIDQWIIDNNAEGIISKDLESPYIYNNRKSWSKYKHFQDITCQVIGFTNGEGKYNRDDMIGALQVIPEGYDKMTLVGSGYTDQERIQMRQLINSNKKIKIDVKYQEITIDNALQFPIFLRIREVL